MGDSEYVAGIIAVSFTVSGMPVDLVPNPRIPQNL